MRGQGSVQSRTHPQSHSVSWLTNGREATQVEVEWSPVGHDLGHCDVVSRGHDMTKQISPATMPSYVCTKGANGRLCRITQFVGRNPQPIIQEILSMNLKILPITSIITSQILVRILVMKFLKMETTLQNT